MKTRRSKFRIGVSAALLLASFALTAFALSLQQIADKGICDGNHDDCRSGCSGLSGIGALYHTCLGSCDLAWLKCYEEHGVPLSIKPPSLTPRPGPIGQITPPPKSLPTPTPRKNPGQITPPPKSNPTPTPRKGPGKVGTTGIGRPSPTPSPNGPVLLEKSGKPASTPRPTPKKDHHK
jgi:hypothetical protein